MSMIAQTPTVVNHRERRQGWDAYAKGASLDAMTTQAEREGWLAANKAASYADTSAYLEDLLDQAIERTSKQIARNWEILEQYSEQPGWEETQPWRQ